MTRSLALVATLAVLAAPGALAQNGGPDGRAVKVAVNPASLPPTTQHGYSRATTAPASARVVYAAGQVGWREGEDNRFSLQVDRAFDDLLAVLAEAGAGPEDVVRITLLIVDHDADKLAYLGSKRVAVFGEEAPPASTLIPVARLYAPGVTFEIDATAVVAE